MQSASHPITTPKGTAALTIILAVIGVFTPFVTSLQAAQLFAVVAVLVIVWLYAAEAWDCLKSRSGYKRLLSPAISLLVICGVAVSATVIVSEQKKPTPVAAITLADVSSAVNDALKRNNSVPPEKVIVQPERTVDYRVIIAEPPLQPAPQQAQRPKIASPADFEDDLRKQINRIRAGTDAQTACITRQSKLSMGLYSLIADAARMQNTYHDGRNSKKMVADLAAWIPQVEQYFAVNKDDLPDVEMFRLASQGQDARTFLGINQSGLRAWAEMDAKRHALELMAKQVSARSCEAIRTAAVAKCSEDKTC